MTAAVVNFEVRRTESFYAELQIMDAAGAPMDLTGLSLWMHVRKQALAPVAMELTTENGRIVLVTPVTGIIGIDIDNEDLMEMALGDYVQDLAIHDTDNQVLWAGEFILFEGVTR